MDTETQAQTAPGKNEVHHRDFARRIAQACDGNPDVPPLNKGRYVWFVEQLDKRGVYSTNETVRKWLSGINLPRPKMMAILAEILKVDEAWLSIGKVQELDERQRRLRNATADGAVNVIAGFVQMAGANPAFPVDNDARAEAEHIDLYAIIRGAQYAFHVALASEDGEGWRFSVPVGAERAFVLGVIPTGPLSMELIEIDSDGLLANGKRKGAHYDLRQTSDYRAAEHQFKRIKGFNERL